MLNKLSYIPSSKLIVILCSVFSVVVVAFSLHARILGECSKIHFPPSLVFLLFFFFFFKVHISWRTLISLFSRPGSVHSDLMSWYDCDWVLPDELHVSSFPDRFSHYAWTAAYSSHSDFVESKGVCMFRCNLLPALFAEWPGSFTCHCGNRGVECTPNKSQHTKLILEKKIFPLLLLGFELTTFWSWVWCSNQQAIPLFLYAFMITQLLASFCKEGNLIFPLGKNLQPYK